ncbi:MAG TPA: hypothetical protein VLA71_16380 [Algoriphagus sp.]|nr:hypothetical protein [Algoriphagus sp.]
MPWHTGLLSSPVKDPLDQPPTMSMGVLYRFWNLDSIEYLEQVHIVLLNSGNWVLGICSINTGP